MCDDNIALNNNRLLPLAIKKKKKPRFSLENTDTIKW